MLRVRVSRAFKDHLHQTSLPKQGTVGRGRNSPKATWLVGFRAQDSSRIQSPKCKSSSTQQLPPSASWVPSTTGKRRSTGLRVSSSTKSLCGLSKSLPFSGPRFYHLPRVNFCASWVVMKVKEASPG